MRKCIDVKALRTHVTTVRGATVIVGAKIVLVVDVRTGLLAVDDTSAA